MSLLAFQKILEAFDRTPDEFVRDFPHVVVGFLLLICAIVMYSAHFEVGSAQVILLIGGILTVLGLVFPLNRKE